MRKIEKKQNPVLNKILINKFLNYLTQNGKKSKSKKLLAHCFIYTDKLLKKKFLRKNLHGFTHSPKLAKKSSATIVKSKNKDSSPILKETPQSGHSFTRALLEKKAGKPIPRHPVNNKYFYQLLPRTGEIKVHPTSGSSAFFYKDPIIKLKKKISSKITPDSLLTTKMEVTGQQKFAIFSTTFVPSPKPKRNSLLPPRGVTSFPKKGTAESRTSVPPSGVKKKRKLSTSRYFQKAFLHIRPLIFLQKLRKGGRSRYIPRPLPPKKGMFLAMKWVVAASKKRKSPERTGSNNKAVFSIARSLVSQSLANEVWNCFVRSPQGSSWRKKEELHKLGSENRAFIRYNWWK